jgi:hypothetical protein
MDGIYLDRRRKQDAWVEQDAGRSIQAAYA